MKNEVEDLKKYGQSLIGKVAQSRLLKMFNDHGRSILEPAAQITAFEIVSWCGEPKLMVTLDGQSVFEETLVNIQ